MLTVLFEGPSGKLPIPIGRKWLQITAENYVGLSEKSPDDFHALVKRAGESVFITNAGEGGDLLINGTPIKTHLETPLSDGDRIQRRGLGDALTVRIVPGGPEENEYNYDYIDAVTLIDDSTGTFIPIDPANASFGFAADEVKLAWQGVGATATEYMVDRYRPIQVVSKGGMGKIILVQEKTSGRFVALKVMLETATSDASLVQQFVREAVITARLQHPHIIPVHDLGFFNSNQLYYTMSYIEGASFEKTARRVDLSERLRILRSAAMGVNYAHSKGLWHRDLKPSNILVGHLGDTYVIDWGLVTIQPGREYKLGIPSIVIENTKFLIPDNLLVETPDAITSVRSGELLGTPAYMAPEQVMNQEADFGAVSDVWAFGVMLFEAITGKHPYSDILAKKVVGDILYEIINSKRPIPSDFARDTPRALSDLCRRMLEKDPKKRLGSLKVFIDDIAAYLQGIGQHVTSFGTPLPALSAGLGGQTADTSMRAQNDSLRAENEKLASELERIRQKNKILAELTQLHWFDRTGRRRLWSELAQL